VKAEEIIALETALRDLARLYESALLFTPLRARAENDLMPQMNRIGASLRHAVRARELEPVAVETAARELHALTDGWQRALDEIRTGDIYNACVSAYVRRDQHALCQLLPQLFAGLAVMPRPHAELYYPLSVAAPRRRPGAQPFLTPAAAAESIVCYADGIEPEDSGAGWWEETLRAVLVAEEPAALDSAVTLAVDLRARELPIFRADGEVTLRIYTPRLEAPFHVLLAREAADEWWESSAQPYAEFRDALCELLEARGIVAVVAD
jgi:hypothetical protein